MYPEPALRAASGLGSPEPVSVEGCHASAWDNDVVTENKESVFYTCQCVIWSVKAGIQKSGFMGW